MNLSDFLIKENHRVGLFVASSADDTSFDFTVGEPREPSFEGKEGAVVDNEYGVNMKRRRPSL